MQKSLFREALRQWDQKSAPQIKDIYQRFSHNGAFLENCLDFLQDPEMQRGASWLLKHHVAQKPQTLPKALLVPYFEMVAQLDHWESKLHMLQSLEHLSVPTAQKPKVEAFLWDCQAEDRLLLRAWAYYGLAKIAVDHKSQTADIKLFLEEKSKTERAGSIQVRLRKALALL